MDDDQDKFLAQHAQTKITVEQLDELFEWVLAPKGLKFSWIIHVIKLVAVVGYLWARQKCLDDTWRISVQKYERDRVNKNRDEVEDDLA